MWPDQSESFHIVTKFLVDANVWFFKWEILLQNIRTSFNHTLSLQAAIIRKVCHIQTIEKQRNCPITCMSWTKGIMNIPFTLVNLAASRLPLLMRTPCPRWLMVPNETINIALLIVPFIHILPKLYDNLSLSVTLV